MSPSKERLVSEMPPREVDEDHEELAKELGQCILITSATITIYAGMLLCGFLVPGLSRRGQNALWTLGVGALLVTAILLFVIYVHAFGCWRVKPLRKRRRSSLPEWRRRADVYPSCEHLDLENNLYVSSRRQSRCM